jgi:hypothetical protein
MMSVSYSLDLDLWLDRQLVTRQNLLKQSFLEILGEVGDQVTWEELAKIHPAHRGKKISKGNDLLGFPYQVLDLIRDFDSATGLDIRLLNWFGNGLFLFVLIGKDHPCFSKSDLLQFGFSFGLSDSPFSYGELIWDQNSTSSPTTQQKEAAKHLLWIKKMELKENRTECVNTLTSEVKKIIKFLANHLG